MRWQRRGPSDDLEDMRGQGGGGGRGGPGIRVGIGGLAVLVALSLLTGQNFLSLLDDGALPLPGSESAASRPSSPAEDELVEFVSFVLDDAQNVWTEKLPRYRRAKLVLFTDSVRSGCGFAESAMGPFYCPADEKVYIDLGFYNELRNRFGAPGDFAQAYVIAHEIGHHVQNLLGIAAKVREQQERDPRAANALSVRMELQADCFAGVWANSTEKRQILERGDIEEGLAAAAAVGDDRIQKGAGGRVNPETWTHGSASQRASWFNRGLRAGSIDACDTFADRG